MINNELLSLIANLELRLKGKKSDFDLIDITSIEFKSSSDLALFSQSNNLIAKKRIENIFILFKNNTRSKKELKIPDNLLFLLIPLRSSSVIWGAERKISPKFLAVAIKDQSITEGFNFKNFLLNIIKDEYLNNPEPYYKALSLNVLAGWYRLNPVDFKDVEKNLVDIISSPLNRLKVLAGQNKIPANIEKYLTRPKEDEFNINPFISITRKTSWGVEISDLGSKSIYDLDFEKDSLVSVVHLDSQIDSIEEHVIRNINQDLNSLMKEIDLGGFFDHLVD
jgi:hypothetical protein